MLKIKDLTKKRIEESFSKLEKNPLLLQIPLSNLERVKKESSMHPLYIKKWEWLLSQSPADIKKQLLAETEEGEILRSTSIFVGL